MSGPQYQAAWRSPFPNQKYHETRTFLRSVQISRNKTNQKDFLHWHRIQFDAGHSFGLSSSWSLLLVSCGIQEEEEELLTGSFKPVNVDYLGLFLDNFEEQEEEDLWTSEVIPESLGNKENKIPFEFEARCIIEILGSDYKISITEREIETFPKEGISAGFWGWRKIPSITSLPTGSVSDLLASVLNLRITFTLNGKVKDTLAKIPSSHVNLMIMQHSEEERIAICIYNLVKKQEDAASCGDIKIRTGTGREFLVHKNVISNRSEVFARMFESQMSESLKSLLKIKDISDPTMDCLLRHLYTGQLETEWLAYPQIAAELVNSAQKYWLTSLLTFCDKNLVQAANEENCLKLLDLANIHKLKTAVKDLTKYVEENGRRFEEEEEEQELYDFNNN